MQFDVKNVQFRKPIYNLYTLLSVFLTANHGCNIQYFTFIIIHQNAIIYYDSPLKKRNNKSEKKFKSIVMRNINAVVLYFRADDLINCGGVSLITEQNCFTKRSIFVPVVRLYIWIYAFFSKKHISQSYQQIKNMWSQQFIIFLLK